MIAENLKGNFEIAQYAFLSSFFQSSAAIYRSVSFDLDLAYVLWRVRVKHTMTSRYPTSDKFVATSNACISCAERPSDCPPGGKAPCSYVRWYSEGGGTSWARGNG